MSKRRTDVPFRERAKARVAECEAYGGIGNTKLNEWLRSGRVKSTLVDGMRLVDVPSFLAVLDGEDQPIEQSA